jgi:hypothetical protein
MRLTVLVLIACLPAAGGAALAAGGSDHIERAGQGRFDATGNVPCAQARGQPMGQCPFGVARGEPGDATVVITWPDGRTRTIFFAGGKPLTADVSQADGNAELHWRKEADLTLIRLGDERYDIPEALVFGG